MSDPASNTTPFNELLGTRCVLREPGRTRYELDVGPDHLNRTGVAHGGVTASLLDTALGAAVVASLGPEERTGTLQLSVQFREALLPGLVTVEGRVARRGRTVAFAEGEIRDLSGRLLATAHGVWTIGTKKPS
jgi:uncharacterized protein (TIGR00369 family)